MTEPVDYALAYRAIGWHVFPIKPGTKQPIGHLTPNGYKNATTDEAVIRSWWAEVPGAGIGIAVQASGLVVVDVDPRNGGHFDLERIELERGQLRTDVEALTGGGGQHLVFLAPADVGRLPGRLAKGIDLKSDGYIVVEPSAHPSGRRYEWEASSNPLEGCVPSPLPGWIADMARGVPIDAGGVQRADAAPVPRALAAHELDDINGALTFIPAGERQTWLTVGMALHKDVGGALGYELWCTWSKTCPEKYDPQDQQRVWRSFTRKPMGEAVQLGTVFDLAYKHGFSRPKVAPPAAALVVPPGEPDPRTLNTTPEIVAGPKVQLQAMPVQGLNDLARWVYDSTPNAHGLLAQATALALACAAAGRRYVSEYGDPANVFFGLITPTSSQARPMLTAAESALIDCNLRHLVRSQRMGSAQQVYASFMRSSSVLYAADDWGDQLAAAKRQPSGLLSVAHGVLAGRVHAAKDIALDNWAEVGLTRKPDDLPAEHMPTLYRPALTLMAAIAEPTLRAVFKRAEFGRGALDCMLFVPALQLDDWVDRSVTAREALPANVFARLRELRGLPADAAEASQPKIDSVVVRATPIKVRFACDLAAAEARWIEHSRKLPAYLRPLSWGARATMRRICVAMAAFNDPGPTPLVRAEMLTWCERLTRECLEMTLAEVQMLGDDDDRPDAASKLVEALVRAGPDGMAQRDLHKQCWAYKKLSSEDRLEVLGRLLADDEITDINTPRGKRYYARQFVIEKSAQEVAATK